MRILHIITGLGDGGAEAVLYRLIKHDYQNNHQVISLRGDDKYGEIIKNEGINVICLNLHKRPILGLFKLFITTYSLSFDVIQTWMVHGDLVGGILGKLYNKPVVWGLHSTNLNNR